MSICKITKSENLCKIYKISKKPTDIKTTGTAYSIGFVEHTPFVCSQKHIRDAKNIIF